MFLSSPFCLWIGNLTFPAITDLFTEKPIHPTYEQLEKRGFYIFVLPEREVQQRQWKQDIIIGSWNVHCGVLLGDTYNPLIIKYTDEKDNEVFTIQLAWRMTWGISDATTRTQIYWESELTDKNQLIHYSRSGENEIYRNLYQFQDMQGYNVDIVSSLPVTETLNLIQQIEYIGPARETLANPWNCGN
jgi:hypothetical protein